MFRYLLEILARRKTIFERQERMLEIATKDMLDLEDAAFYLGVNTGTLLEEAGLGYFPGGRLAGEWRFYKYMLQHQFSIYQKSREAKVSEEDKAKVEKALDDCIIYCTPQEVENLLQGYMAGIRNFSGYDLPGANLNGFDLMGILFIETDLRRADLSRSNLVQASFLDAQLRGANLSQCDLTQADLREADLRDAVLRGACLHQANLRGAKLEGADLSYAELRDTLL